MLSGGGSEGRISHEAMKDDRNWEGVRRPNSHFYIKANFFWELNIFGNLTISQVKTNSKGYY